MTKTVMKSRINFNPKSFEAGDKVGRLTVLEDTDKRKAKSGQKIYLCECECGNKVERSQDSLRQAIRNNNIASCGCFLDEWSKEWDIGNRFLHDSLRVEKSRESLVPRDGTTMQGILFRKKLNKNNTSGYRGVRWLPREQKWQARIVFKRKEYNLGYYENIEDAIKAREAGEEKYYKPVIYEYMEEKENKEND